METMMNTPTRTASVKLSRVNECLALVADVNGAELDSYAAMCHAGLHTPTVAKRYAAVVGWTVRHCNAIATLVASGIMSGEWLNGGTSCWLDTQSA